MLFSVVTSHKKMCRNKTDGGVNSAVLSTVYWLLVDYAFAFDHIVTVCAENYGSFGAESHRTQVFPILHTVCIEVLNEIGI